MDLFYYPEDVLILNKTMGQTIKKIRKKNNLTQLKLAEMSGVSRNTISLVELGKISPTFFTLYQIASTLDITLYELLVEFERIKSKDLYK